MENKVINDNIYNISNAGNVGNSGNENNACKNSTNICKQNDCDISFNSINYLTLEIMANTESYNKYLKKNNLLDIDENGHQFFNLKTLLKFKLTLNRPKNQDDIVLIKSII